jgi:5-methylcytosine-specific restriction endonuclease McrA
MRERRTDPIEAQRVKDERKRHRDSPQGRAWRRERYVIDNAAQRQRHTGAPCTLTAAQWAGIRELFGYCCAYCGCQPGQLEIDHVIPISADDYPGTIVGNVVPACQECNLSKANKRVEQWRPDIVPRVRDLLAATVSNAC